MAEGTMLQLMNEGGWVMWVLLLFSIATVAVGIERTLVIQRARVEPRPLLRQLDRLLSAHSISDAIQLCRKVGGPIGHMLEGGLLELPKNRERVEESMETVALADLRKLRRGLGVLVATATTAPLLGFLGTVTGMMSSFQALVDAGMSDPALVALGIKEALTTTAGGLIVAVPAQLLHQALNARLTLLEGDLEAAANHLLKRLGD
ncbi:MAG: MotA/TolQ/ExbB proton channel family protein [Thermoanaerobaculia bacterium]|nr:MotA/TolQ/ExbB proton channel family protein [Thermoanaerobaculia bacterium]